MHLLVLNRHHIEIFDSKDLYNKKIVIIWCKLIARITFSLYLSRQERKQVILSFTFLTRTVVWIESNCSTSRFSDQLSLFLVKLTYIPINNIRIRTRNVRVIFKQTKFGTIMYSILPFSNRPSIVCSTKCTEGRVFWIIPDFEILFEHGSLAPFTHSHYFGPFW